jgi:hypothetical protein
VEQYSAYSYLVIDNNFAGLAAPRPAMRSTIAHEFHHNIQQGYDAGDTLNWYAESTATWMETQVFPQDQEATPYMGDMFQFADLCVGSTPEDPLYSSRIYAEWVLIDTLARDLGFESIQRLWEFVADYEGMEVFYNFLAEYGVTPQDVIERMAVRNLLLDYDPVLAERFPERVRLEGIITSPGTYTPDRDGVQELGVDYLWLRTSGVYDISVDQPNLNLLVVGVNQSTGEAMVYELGQSGTVDTTPYTHTYVLVLNTDTHTDPGACTFTDWNLTVSDGTGTPVTPWDDAFDAANFIPAG